MDEPTSGLDARATIIVMRTLLELVLRLPYPKNANSNMVEMVLLGVSGGVDYIYSLITSQVGDNDNLVEVPGIAVGIPVKLFS
ncbi:hypothetical protein ACS0TY_028290 [Phlomoides rotata]